jgi:uncharacterized protein (DUF2235 family)
MPRDIVVRCDGTGNKYSNKNTNAMRLSTTLDSDDKYRQVAYYHIGLGIMGSPNTLTRVARFWTRAIGLAFGLAAASLFD